MRKFWSQISFFSLVIAATITLACGSSSQHSIPAIPQSVTVAPATAEGQAQFVATAHYANEPPVTPLTAFWGACYQNAPTSDITITNKGLAQCESGASGTYSVFASVPTLCLATTACGGGCQVSGYAQLTCP